MSFDDAPMLTPPPCLLPWLSYQRYLSKKLEAKAGQTELQVIQQTWLAQASAWDQERLALGPEAVLHRDSLILAHQRPCWFARTILPRATYDSHLSLFERLNKEPLGNLIFRTEAVQRLRLEHYSIEAGSVEYDWLPKAIDTQQKLLWLRCSTFQVKDAELFYLVEILLPDLEHYS